MTSKERARELAARIRVAEFAGNNDALIVACETALISERNAGENAGLEKAVAIIDAMRFEVATKDQAHLMRIAKSRFIEAIRAKITEGKAPSNDDSALYESDEEECR